MSELPVAEVVRPYDGGSDNAMAGIGFMGGWPTAYVLEKLGTELRKHYMPFVREPLPQRLTELVERLPRA
jgi:hypothetical protein